MKEKLFNSQKALISMVLLIFIIIVTIIIINQKSNKNTQSLTKSDMISNNTESIQASIAQNIYSVGDYDLKLEDQNKIIKNVEEFKNYLTSIYTEDNLEELISRYNEDFFAERAIALTYVKLSNNKQIPNVDSLNINENSLEIGYSIKETEKESNFSSYIILIETDQTVESVRSTQL